MKYKQEYEQYADYALERYLIEKEGYNEYDAKVKVMQDYDEVKKWFEETEKVSLPARSYERTDRRKHNIIIQMAGRKW